MHTHEEVQKQIKIYVRVFLALAVLTVVTVGVAYLHMPLLSAIVAALLIATVKSSLVAGFFMHLAAEKKIIYGVLALAFVFFTVLLIGPSWHHY